MNIKSICVGFTTATALFATISILSLSKGWVVTKYHRDRAVHLMVVNASLRNAQMNYAGQRDDRGCYVFNHNRWQSSISYYQYSSHELGQSINDLLCNGWTMPADL